uniref:Holin n=1 Tax=Serratia phage Kevin TaxID=3161161 RepID=A0AAU8KXN5_9CAUD
MTSKIIETLEKFSEKGRDMSLLFAVYLFFGWSFVALASSAIFNADEETVIALEIIWYSGAVVFLPFVMSKQLLNLLTGRSRRRATFIAKTNQIVTENQAYLKERK